MKNLQKASCVLLATTVYMISLCGCGITVPDIKEPYDHRFGTSELEFEIKRRVYCDLKIAVMNINDANRDIAPGGYIPLSWGAHMSLSLEVDENSALNPGASLNTPLASANSFFPAAPAVVTPQSFSLGLGGTLSSTATRIDKSDSYYSIDYLMVKPTSKKWLCLPNHDPIVEQGKVPNPTKSSFLVQSDLHIFEWLDGAMASNRLIPSVAAFPTDIDPNTKKAVTVSGAGAGIQPDTMTLEIKFIVVTSGSITPTWKLVRVSANTTTPFFGAGRTRTHDLIITIGPNNQLTAGTLLASQVGLAVSAGNRAGTNF